MKKTVKITIGVGDAFKGTLRCALTMNDASKDFPSRLKSVSITPLLELKNKPKASTSTTLEPLPKRDPRELDLSTLNILLRTMKSVVILSDSSEQRQYLFEPSTSCTATLAPYSATAIPAGATPKSRLAKAMSESSRLSLDDLIESNKPSPSKKRPVKNALAWFHCMEKGDEEPLIMLDLAEAMNTCIAKNEPTPQYLVTEIIPNVILGWTHVVDKLKMKQVISKLWMTTAAMQARIRNKDRDKSELLRQIQIQSLLRLQLLAMDRKSFLKVFSKQLMEKKRRGGCSDLINEVTTILEGACFLLEANKTLPELLGETIPASLYCSTPDAIQEVFDFFECPNPFLEDDDDAESDRSSMLALESTACDYNDYPASPSIPSPKKKQKRHEQEQKVVKFEDGDKVERKPVSVFLEGSQHEDLTMRSVHLTARRRSNPLIKDSRASYVGSHFNTKLANISAHYHEVPVVQPASNSNRQFSSRRTSHHGAAKAQIRSSIATKSPRKARSSVRQAKATSPLRNKFVVREAPSRRRVVGESPCAARGRLSQFDVMSVKQETLFGSDSSNKVVVGETPVKSANKKKENHLHYSLSNNMLKTKVRKPFSVTTKNKKDGLQINQEQHQLSVKKTSFNARRMAQEALAASRRGKK